MVSIYVYGDHVMLRTSFGCERNERGANVQLIGPNDAGVFHGEHPVDGLPCVPAVQAYLDLLHLPERARDAARQLREDRLLWDAAG